MSLEDPNYNKEELLVNMVNQKLLGKRVTQVLFVFLLALMQASGVHALVKDKSALYEKYPQLISNDTNPCIRGLN